ncbi:MAG: glycosyl transferase family protein [Pseudomonadota bacterium]
MSLAEHVATLGRGPGRSRSLTRDEAEDAMALMLRQDAAPEAVGALLMLLRMKGETADEIAGLSAGAQSSLRDMPQVDLDWPSYAAGRSRGLPWFLLSARLVANAGYRVFLHGWNGRDQKVRDGLAAAGIPVSTSTADAAEALDRWGVSYMPLETLHPTLFGLLDLRRVLGLRSCINTIARMLNPGMAAAGVQGVFHPSYRLKQAEAAQMLGWTSLTVIKGGGGEFERHPGKAVSAYGLRRGALVETVMAPVAPEAVRLADGPAPDATLKTVWTGVQDDAFATAIILGTAALALDTLGADKPNRLAAQLWDTRLSTSRSAA